MSDEVELSDERKAGSDDYEVIPMGPVRKLENRIKKLEKQQVTGGGSSSSELVSDVMDIMKSNQKIVNDMVESTSKLHNSVETLIDKMDNVSDQMSGFMELLKDASETSLEEDVSSNIKQSIVDPISEGMQDLQETNEQMLQGLGKIDKSLEQLDKRMKRLSASNRTSSGRKSRRPNRRRKKKSGDK